MMKQVISLASHWHETGALSPFRDLAVQLATIPTDFPPLAGYESLLQLLLQSENGPGRFVPALYDPCVPNRETTHRIADGVVNLMTALLEKGYSFQIVAYDTSFDSWTQYCLERLQRRGFFNSLQVRYEHKPSNGRGLLPEEALKEKINSAIRFGFSWNVPHVLLRPFPARARDWQAAHNFLGHSLLAYRKYLAAQKHFEVALGGNDPHMRACAKLGNIYCAVRFGMEQDELLRFIEGIAPDIESIEDSSVRRRLQVLLPNLQAFILQKSEPSRALNLLEVAIAQAKEYRLPLHLAVFLKNKAVLLQQVGQPLHEVTRLFELALSYRPFDPDWYCELGQIYLRQGDVAAAMRSFQAAYEPGLPVPNALMGLAQCASSTQKYPEEFKYRKAMIELRPNISSFYTGLGKSSLKVTSSEESIQIFLHAWDLDPEQDAPAYELLRLLLQNEIPDTSHYRGEIEGILSRRKRPVLAKLGLLIGRFFLKNHNRELARYYLEQALTSDDPQILFVSNFSLGNLMVEQGLRREARAFYNRCLALQPESKEVAVVCARLEQA